ncbi:MAG: hypothetical protein IPN76_14700 [Saprospiraceae bacterium]|nr:hypothetical protein [Saprospiraceae bacterium]
MVTQGIDDDGKEKLLGLYNPDSTGFNSYKIAVEELTFHSNTLPKPSYLLTLLIGGLAAVIGVQIRTIHRFVYRACYVQDMNIHVWWPWYVMRPIIGFLLGCTVVLLAQVNLLTVTGDKSSLYFWIGFAVLAGFGTPDVVDKLHQLSITLFGTKSSNESGNDAELVSNDTNADPNVDQGGGK